LNEFSAGSNDYDPIVLVDADDVPQGVAPKIEVHRRGLKHRAISVLVRNQAGEMLVHRRNPAKYHSGGLWTNACCSHPRPGEDTRAAALRRLREELGFTTDLFKLFEFTYRTAYDNGLTEFEFDHVFVGTYDQEISPDQTEVSDYRYRSMPEIEAELNSAPETYSSWFQLAFPLLKEKIGALPAYSQRFN
jgi:isopentenyl-diphosphate delta-isomerase